MIVITYTENKNIYLNQSWSYAYTVCCKSCAGSTLSRLGNVHGPEHVPDDGLGRAAEQPDCQHQHEPRNQAPRDPAMPITQLATSIGDLPHCLKPLSPWTEPAFLRA
jgi:hypothetical protein